MGKVDLFPWVMIDFAGVSRLSVALFGGGFGRRRRGVGTKHDRFESLVRDRSKSAARLKTKRGKRKRKRCLCICSSGRFPAAYADCRRSVGTRKD